MIQGMLTSLTNLFKKPATINYPFESVPKAPRYRGLIHYNENNCIFCLKCETACPPEAILFTRDPEGQDHYHYNPYLCIYCGECVRACPEPGKEGALWQDEDLIAPATFESEPGKAWEAVEAEAASSKAAYKKKVRRKETPPTAPAGE